MALPTSMTANPFKRAVTGIRLGIVPSTQLPPFEVELQRSTANSTASSMWRSDFLAPAGAGYAYSVELPLSTRTFYFRARHVGLGYSAGAFSPTVSAKPVKLGGTFTPIGFKRNKLGNFEALGADIWLSSAKTARVGTQQSTGSITKTLRFAAHQFQPQTTAAKFVLSNAGLAVPTAGAGSTHSFWGIFFFPPGVTLTSCTLEGERRQATSKSFVKLVTYRQFHGFASTWFTINLAQTTGALTFTDTGSSVLSQAITSTGIVGRLDIFRAGGAGSSQTSNARAHAVTWKYKMPSYDKAV